ncbi:hypothetical protein OHS70_02820 [Streptomyces sp. NBC_00390]|uniref:DUF6777 domain-containing protein n=1 Tax=Streptomyces sp. NBC_00390 TaxID=2975736 RepID=UPI002E1C9944
MRSPMRRVCAAAAALSVGLLMSGCDGAGRAHDSAEVHLQALASPGPAPFTASTATSASVPVLPPVTAVPVGTSRAGGPVLRTLSGSAPGLYSGTQEVGSCDVEKQVRFLDADKAKVRAFAKGAGIQETVVPAFLRGLTPVMLRADTRITAHVFRDGTAVAQQAVMQAGTAVLVDQYGAPRVRCAGGNPLKPPVAAAGAVTVKGTPWQTYRTDQVVVIKPANQVVRSLMIVNNLDNGWIERPTGTDGAEDAQPAVFPPVNPDEVFMDTLSPAPNDSVAPAEPSAPAEQAAPPAPAPADPAPAPVDPEPTPAPADPQPVPPAPVPADPQPAPADPQPAPADPQRAPADPRPVPSAPAPADPQPEPPVDPPQPQGGLDPMPPDAGGPAVDPVPDAPASGLPSRAATDPGTFQG